MIGEGAKNFILISVCQVTGPSPTRATSHSHTGSSHSHYFECFTPHTVMHLWIGRTSNGTRHERKRRPVNCKRQSSTVESTRNVLFCIHKILARTHKAVRGTLSSAGVDRGIRKLSHGRHLSRPVAAPEHPRFERKYPILYLYLGQQPTFASRLAACVGGGGRP